MVNVGTGWPGQPAGWQASWSCPLRRRRARPLWRAWCRSGRAASRATTTAASRAARPSQRMVGTAPSTRSRRTSHPGIPTACPTCSARSAGRGDPPGLGRRRRSGQLWRQATAGMW